MRRLAPLFTLCAAAACLDPGAPYLHPEDDVPPSVLESHPARGEGAPDLIRADEPLAIVFSEELDVRSLRPGIVVRKENRDVAIEVFAQGDGGVATNTQVVTGRDRPYPVGVRRAGGLHWETFGTYTLRLNTLLIDTEGNALPEELDIRFEALPLADGGTL